MPILNSSPSTQLLRRRVLTLPLALAAMAAVPALHAQNASAAQRPIVLVVGDSISAEYGLPRGTGWVTLLQQKLDADKVPVQLINASISGDTTAGGRARLPQLLKTHKPQVVVLELGANDALRGLPLAQTRANLSAMAKASQAAGARVLLVGMQVPPNYGVSYTRDFAQAFVDVSKAEKTALLPFLLKGVADVPSAAPHTQYFQADRLHPNAKAQPIMAANVLPELRKLLRK